MTATNCKIETWTASDGYVAHYRHYAPAEIPLAHVVCLHGIQSHGGWYDYSSRRLAEAGFAVYYLDRRGSGLNQAARGDAPNFRRLLDDIAEFAARLRDTGAKVPVVIMGVSWGGKLALALCRRQPAAVDAVALICPGLFAKVRPSLAQRLGIFFARLISPLKQYPIPLSDPALFTATEKWQQFIADDPLSLRTATARLLVESLRLDLYLPRVRRRVKVPVLLMLAGRDRIIDNDRIRRLVAKKLPAGDKWIIEYAEAHHTLEFEPSPDRFIDDLIEWLKRVSAR